MATATGFLCPYGVRMAFTALVVVLALPGRGALPLLPPVAGEFYGQLAIEGLAPLPWVLTVEPVSESRQRAVFAINADGLALRAALESDPAGGSLTWRLDDAQLDLSVWSKWVVSHLPAAMAGALATGSVHLSGVGTIEDGKPVGSVALECRNVVLRHPEKGWTFDGVELHGQFALRDGGVTSMTPLELVVRTITTERFGARHLFAKGELKDADTFAVTTARLEIAGGEVDTDAFDMTLSAPAFETRVHIKRVGLQDFVALVPSGLSDARGRIHGDLGIAWSAASGLTLGTGNLALDEIEPTMLRLAPSSGFLTSSVPARIEFLPGYLGRLFSFINPSYEDLRLIELGQMELQVKSLKVNLSPDGDPLGNTASVTVEARPAKAGSCVELVTFSINVSGPLAAVLRMGMNESFSTSMR